MPGNGFSIGKDVVLDIITPTGVLRPKIRTGFSSKMETTSLMVRGMDGVMLFDELPAGWTGSFDLDRADSTLDDFFAQRESDYYGGLTSPIVTITETISEVSGAISQYRYTGVALKFEDAGNKGADKVISQKISFKAARRIKIS
jgi:hypothetical protein